MPAWTSSVFAVKLPRIRIVVAGCSTAVFSDMISVVGIPNMPGHLRLKFFDLVSDRR